MTRCRKLAALSAIVAAILAAGVTDALPHAWAASDGTGEAGRGTSREAGPEEAGHVELQRQVNELRSDLLDERERRIERQLEASGAVLVVLAIVIGGGGLWFYARFRAIAADARIGAALARAYVPDPEGLLPGAATSLPPPGERPGPLRLLGHPGPEADPDTVARANGHARASSFAAPRPQASPRALASDGHPGPAGPAIPAPDDDVERREDAIADCTEAIRLDPPQPPAVPRAGRPPLRTGPARGSRRGLRPGDPPRSRPCAGLPRPLPREVRAGAARGGRRGLRPPRPPRPRLGRGTRGGVIRHPRNRHLAGMGPAPGRRPSRPIVTDRKMTRRHDRTPRCVQPDRTPRAGNRSQSARPGRPSTCQPCKSKEKEILRTLTLLALASLSKLPAANLPQITQQTVGIARSLPLPRMAVPGSPICRPCT